MVAKLDTTRKVAILVLGAHRSGTSSIAGILDGLGCQGPKTPLEKNQWNEKGFFESRPIVCLNDKVLAAAGSKWDDWRPLCADWQKSPRFNEFRGQAMQEIVSEFGDSSLIYIKDPRICRLLPFWKEVLEGSGYDITCVHVHRNPEDVAASLNQREGMHTSIAMLIWLRHVLEAEFNSRGLPRVFFSYCEILDNWTLLLRKLEEALGFSFPALLPDAQSLIDPRLSHHNTWPEHLLNNEFASNLIKGSLRVFEQWVATVEQEDDYATLDAMRAQFDHCVPLFSAPMEALEREAQRYSALLDDATRTRAELATHQKEAEDAQKHVDELTVKLADTEAERLELQKELESAAAKLTALTDEANTVTDRLIERDKTIAKLRSDNSNLNRTVDEVRRSYTNSTSWRVSAPVRAVGTLLRRRG